MSIVNRRIAEKFGRTIYGFGSHNASSNWHKWREAQFLAGTPKFNGRKVKSQEKIGFTNKFMFFRQVRCHIMSPLGFLQFLVLEFQLDVRIFPRKQKSRLIKHRALHEDGGVKKVAQSLSIQTVIKASSLKAFSPTYLKH